ncbi:MAG: hypothetical protein GX219_03145 [Tissierellia bacterium]|nr:hypothetical protein [Tissierellia bacterium]
MERFKSLNKFQKFILIFQLAMVLVFFFLFIKVTSRVGYEYLDTVLVPVEEDGRTVYSGKIDGSEGKFIVTDDKTVTFKYGGKTYGPYTAKEDRSAIPDDFWAIGEKTGLELYKGYELIFRGVRVKDGDKISLYKEDGSPNDFSIQDLLDGRHLVDKDGNLIDDMEPSPSDILNLMYKPRLTSKGNWQGWVFGLFFSIINIVSILFADELFRLNLSFQIRDVESVDPSDWEIASRYILWVFLTLITLAYFIVGLGI